MNIEKYLQNFEGKHKLKTVFDKHHSSYHADDSTLQCPSEFCEWKLHEEQWSLKGLPGKPTEEYWKANKCVGIY